MTEAVRLVITSNEEPPRFVVDANGSLPLAEYDSQLYLHEVFERAQAHIGLNGLVTWMHQPGLDDRDTMGFEAVERVATPTKLSEGYRWATDFPGTGPETNREKKRRLL